MFTFFFRLCFWLVVLSGMTFFWIAVFDASDTGLVESFARNAACAAEFVFNRGPAF